MSGLPETRRHEWEAEARYLRSRIQIDQRRVEELEEILRTLFPEKSHG